MAQFSDNSQSSVVFVGNLPWTAKEEELREYLQGAGNILSVEMKTHADTGRSKGWALVQYESPDMAQFAIQHFHDQDFQGRNLNVRIDRSELDKLGGVTLFVGNLPWTCKDEDLSGLFSRFHPIDVHVKTFQSGKSRGFGIVRLSDATLAAQAIELLNGYDMSGRAIEVREERPRPEPGTAPAPRRKQQPKAAPAAAAAAAAAPSTRPQAEPSNTLYVSNLSWTSTDDDLFQHFSTSGVIPDSAKVQFIEKSHRSKGWGLVVYKTVEEATRAKDALHRTELDGRPISVRFDSPRA